jgi:hypothetical protein
MRFREVLMTDDTKIFPISDREADLLHELGWNSGFGWRTEWDWWHRSKEIDQRDDDANRLLLMRHVLFIRAAVKAAEDHAKRMLKSESL